MFELLDDGDKQYLNLENFFGLIDVLENNRNFLAKKARDNKCWTAFRASINGMFKFDRIAHSSWFAVFMMLVILFNIGKCKIFSYH